MLVCGKTLGEALLGKGTGLADLQSNAAMDTVRNLILKILTLSPFLMSFLMS